jgi:hypothetical protein
MSILPGNLDLIPKGNLAAPCNHGKYPFAWHDTVAHRLENSTVAVTLLAYLGDDKRRLPGMKHRPHRKRPKVNPISDNILAKIAKLNLGALSLKLTDFFKREKTHLTMPIPRMSVTLQPVTGPQPAALNVSLGRSLLFRKANRHNFARHHTFIIRPQSQSYKAYLDTMHCSLFGHKEAGIKGRADYANMIDFSVLQLELAP